MSECSGAMHVSEVAVRCHCGGGEGCQARVNISRAPSFYGVHHYVKCHGFKYCVHCAELKSFPAPVKYWWFRVRGYGLHFRWVRDGYTPLFSERNGYVKVLKIGRLWIKVLRPDTY